MEHNYILPLGSVLRVKNGKGTLMVIGRAQLFNNQGTIGYFDYSAVLYPRGLISNNNFVFFNHEDIAEVIFEGYRSEDEIAFADRYEEEISKVTYPKLKVESSVGANI